MAEQSEAVQQTIEKAVEIMNHHNLDSDPSLIKVLGQTKACLIGVQE